MKLALSFTIGPSSVSLLAMMLMFPSPWNSRMFPSFMLISRMEERRPPNRAGNPPLVMLMFFTASALNTLKKPNKWFTLYNGTPSRA